MFDSANETIANFNFVNDYVSGYTNSQMFNAFQSNIYTLQDYKARLLQTVSNPTSSQVTGLFAQYHYSRPMKNLIPIMRLLVVAIINSGCPKPCVEANLSFSVTAQIIPDYDSVHVGDTIYLTSSFPTKLTDQSSGQMIDYSNSTGIGSTLAIK